MAEPISTNPPIQLFVAPSAVDPLRRALSVRATGAVVRLFIEPGMHPRVAMIVDTARHDDLRTVVDGIPLVVDPPSRKFLDGATVEFVSAAEGGGFRVTGPNVPTKTPEPSAGSPAPAGGPLPERSDREKALMTELRKLYDPEIPMNIVELGLIYAIEWPTDDSVVVRMTMTSPGCPVIEILRDEVQQAALRSTGVAKAEVDVVWDPPWGPDKMSELARRQLGFA